MSDSTTPATVCEAEARIPEDEHEFRRAQVMALAKIAGLTVCPNSPNTVCGCSPGHCQARERGNG